MKKYYFNIIVICILFSCTNIKKKELIEEKKSLRRYKIDTSLFTKQDNVYIEDNLSYSKEDFNNIVLHFPALYLERVQSPDITYNLDSEWVDIKENGKEKRIDFGGRCGQDNFYKLYAYFLQKKDTLEKFKIMRKNLKEIFQAISDFNGILHYGGTFYGHMDERISADVEYSIYSSNNDFYLKKYDIKNQKKAFIKSLLTQMNDEINNDVNMLISGNKHKNIAKRKAELKKYIDKLDILITDYFYLKKAQEFNYSHYSW